MRIDRHVAGSASQTLVFPVRNVFFGLGINVLFGQAKVDDVDDVFLLIPLSSNEKVFRFYISIDEVFRVHILHSRNLLSKTNTGQLLLKTLYKHTFISNDTGTLSSLFLYIYKIYFIYSWYNFINREQS